MTLFAILATIILYCVFREAKAEAKVDGEKQQRMNDMILGYLFGKYDND